MPFLTIRAILTRVEGFHQEFGRRLNEAEANAEHDEAKLILGFLGNHQRELAGILSQMEKDTPDHVATLNEWVQFDTAVEDPRKFLSDFHVDPDATPQEVLKAANELDVCLFCLYKGMAKGSATPRAQRLFARLARLELDHQKARSGNQSYY